MDTSVIFDPWRAFVLQLAEFLPKLLGALIILVIGWLIAKVTQVGVTKFLKAMKIDFVSEKAGVDHFLVQGGVKQTAVDILGMLVYWTLMLIVILIALNSMGLQTASELLNRIILYIPNVIVAVVVLVMGLFFARFLQASVTTYFSNAGIKNASTLGTIAQYAVIVFVVSIALEQLSIGKELVVSAFQIAFGAICLALALAFGLGGKHWAAGIMAKHLSAEPPAKDEE
ncbi:MAG: hypothetical protein EPO24_16335 [Bacteroidetes bacterium]|nr:MAG: hypothetical protein EPO24_16335 [Bacteroidota bacterium]